MKNKTFRVVYEHDDGGWHVYIPSVKGCRTWGRSLGAARKNIREALSTCVDVFEDAPRVAALATFEDDIRLPPNAKSALRELHRAVAKRAAVEKVARDRAVRAAKILTSKGLSLRDSGDVLGLSQEQVRQMLAAH